MDVSIVRRESAIEYFRELVEAARSHQGVAAGKPTCFYLVQLLAGFLTDGAAEQTGSALGPRLTGSSSNSPISFQR